MKNIILILLTLLLSGCATTYGIKDNREYVRLSELELSKVDKIKLHWMTDKRDSYVIYDSRAECFYYLKEFDYSKVIK